MRRLILVAVLGLAGCAGMQQARQAHLAEFERTIPVCEGEKECEIAWAHARNWVIRNCGMKIQNITDTYIETFGSTDTRLACRVLGEPRGPDSWAIVIRTVCGNIFGCVPDAQEAALRFNNEMNMLIGRPGEDETPPGGMQYRPRIP
jgi:hypothetical protein